MAREKVSMDENVLHIARKGRFRAGIGTKWPPSEYCPDNPAEETCKKRKETVLKAGHTGEYAPFGDDAAAQSVSARL